MSATIWRAMVCRIPVTGVRAPAVLPIGLGRLLTLLREDPGRKAVAFRPRRRSRESNAIRSTLGAGAQYPCSKTRNLGYICQGVKAASSQNKEKGFGSVLIARRCALPAAKPPRRSGMRLFQRPADSWSRVPAGRGYPKHVGPHKGRQGPLRPHRSIHRRNPARTDG